MKKFTLPLLGLLLTGGLFAQQSLSLSKYSAQNAERREAEQRLSEYIAGKHKGLSGTKAATVFLEEDFEGMTIPAGWTLTQNAGANGWEADTADVDARWSPEVPGVGEWFAVSNDSKYDDGANSNDASADYMILPSLDFSNVSEVGMVVDMFFNPEFSLSTADIEVSADAGATWTSVYTVTNDTVWQEEVIIDLTAYAGQTDVRIRFSHNDGGGHASGFAVDNILVTEAVVDLSLSLTFNQGYTLIPEAQIQPIQFGGIVDNLGIATATNVTATGTITDPSANATNLNGDIMPVIEGYETDTFTYNPSFTPAEMGSYTAVFAVDQAQTDDEPSDNTANLSFEVTDSIYGRDLGDINGSVPVGNNVDIGIGLPVNLTASNLYEFVNTDTITAIQMAFGADATAGDQLIINLYPIENGEIIWDFVLASTPVLTKTEAAGTPEVITSPLVGDFYDPLAGDSLVAVAEFPDAGGLTTVASDTNGWVRPGATNLNFEIPAFGLRVSQASPGAPYIRLVLGSFDPANAKPDLEIATAEFSGGYYTTPLTQTQPINFSVTVNNNKSGEATNVEVSLDIYNSGGLVFNNSVNQGAIAGGTQDLLIDLGSYTPDAADNYQAFISISADNNATLIDTLNFIVSDSTYTRDNNAVVASVPFGPNTNLGAGPDSVAAGIIYEVVAEDTVSSVTIITAGNEMQGDIVRVIVYDTTGGQPYSIIMGSGTAVVQADGPGLGTISAVNVVFDGGVVLDPGSYYFRVSLITVDDQSRNLAMANGIYTAGTTFLEYAGQFFDFNALGQEFTPLIWVNFGDVQEFVGIEENLADDLSVFPNPATDQLFVQGAQGSTYQITDIAGKIIAAGTLHGNVSGIQLDAKPGIYLLRISNDIESTTVKFVKR